jgi:hypothetical protein
MLWIKGGIIEICHYRITVYSEVRYLQGITKNDWREKDHN